MTKLIFTDIKDSCHIFSENRKLKKMMHSNDPIFWKQGKGLRERNEDSGKEKLSLSLYYF